MKVLDQGADEKNRASLQKENGGVLEYLPIPSLRLVLQWTRNEGMTVQCHGSVPYYSLYYAECKVTIHVIVSEMELCRCDCEHNLMVCVIASVI